MNPIRKPTARCRMLLAIPLLAAALLSSACGYRSDGLYPTHVRTVAVPIPQSREFRRELEFRLAEALIKQIELDTPYKVVDRHRADTILEAEISQVRQTGYAPDFVTNLPRTKILSLIVSFKWKDLRTGEVLLERRNFIDTRTYISAVGETEYTGMNQVIDRMAERIVEQMQTPF